MTARLLTKNEVADRLRISTRTLDRLRATGHLRAVRVGGVMRFSDAELERFVAKHTAKVGR